LARSVGYPVDFMERIGEIGDAGRTHHTTVPATVWAFMICAVRVVDCVVNDGGLTRTAEAEGGLA
jgi:hypothetical protein